MWHLSHYISTFKKGNHVALWHSLSLRKLYGTLHLEQVFGGLKSAGKLSDQDLKMYPASTIKALQENGFLVQEDDDETEMMQDALRKSELVEIKNLVLLITHECNFNCAYCQIEKNIKTHSGYSMSKRTAQRAIQLFKNNTKASAQKTITITGGEPMLNPDVLLYVIEKVNAELSNKRIVLFTNGSLIDEKWLTVLKDNNVLVLLSLDGPEAMHDRARKDRQGKGTFSQVMENYERLSRHGIQLGISAVGGPHNINHLDELIRFFLELHPSSIGFNFSHHLLTQKNPMELPIAEFGKALVQFYKEMRKRHIFVENISRVIQSFSSRKPRLHECQAEGSGFTVDARGKVGPCKSLLVADIFSHDFNPADQIANHAWFSDWLKRTPLRVKSCRQCPSIMLCGGGCAYDSYISHQGRFQEVDERVCAYQKDMLEFLIWDLFEVLGYRLDQDEIYVPSDEEQKIAFQYHNEEKEPLQRSVGHEG